ncbi:MAG: hypothetical protein F4Y45_15835 [Acidobacteria bacterium]|nr:hypothetical protein [Acidobacteriota bacterium]MYD70696.1 hypothetical protein [Acidobacteriota bacterium]MYJ03314.1 hypothetical protein [Acidobacteriota bacterium]
MARRTEPPASPRSAAHRVRQRIERGRERLWRFDDFPGLPPAALAQALSRLVREGKLERLSKGVYYRPRQTVLGTSRPNPAAIRKLATTRGKPVFPAGIAAANLLGFTTQSAGRSEVSTSGYRLPRKLLGSDTVVHTRRPEAWKKLAETDAALLDFLRRAGRSSELSPDDTVQRTLSLCRQGGRFRRLLGVAASEPPRVRGMLGAIGAELGERPTALKQLRDSLNPLSRFDFGMLRGLAHAKDWQAKRHTTL